MEIWHNNLDSYFEEFRKKSSEREVWITPTYLRYELTFNLDDYGKKASMKRA